MCRGFERAVLSDLVSSWKVTGEESRAVIPSLPDMSTYLETHVTEGQKLKLWASQDKVHLKHARRPITCCPLSQGSPSFTGLPQVLRHTTQSHGRCP